MANHGHGLLSPARSDVSTSHVIAEQLLATRSHPLQPGSPKETTLINYLDERLLQLTERYAKSAAPNTVGNADVSGYKSFSEVASDLDKILEVVWISGTPRIQIPYLLTLAGHFRDFMHSFPFVTVSFALARKFDTAFLRLLTTEPGSSSAVSTTDKVRIKSLAEETRIEMAQMASKEGHSVITAASDDDEEDNEEDEDDPTTMSIATSLGKVYEKTLGIIGSDLRPLPALEQPSDSPLDQHMDDTEVIEL